jgi:hypothetical protein
MQHKYLPEIEICPGPKYLFPQVLFRYSTAIEINIAGMREYLA